jgi:hypothetical protein
MHARAGKRAWGGESEPAADEHQGHRWLGEAPGHSRKLRGSRGGRRRKAAPDQSSSLSLQMSPTWIWMQIAIVVFVLIGMVIAITKLA